MAEVRPLSRAPIKEALIDLQVPYNEEFDFDAFKNFILNHEDGYPEIEDLIRHEFQASVSPNESAPDKHLRTYLGFKSTSSDRQKIVQFRKNGFTLSFLRPYSSWSDLKSEGLRLWEIYCAHASVSNVNRIEVRYINQFQIPVNRSLDEFFTTPPSIPPELPQQIIQSLYRYSMPLTDGGTCVYSLVQAGVTGSNADVVMDIDAYSPIDLAPNDREIWNRLDEFRNFKNLVFFKNLSESFVKEQFE